MVRNCCALKYKSVDSYSRSVCSAKVVLFLMSIGKPFHGWLYHSLSWRFLIPAPLVPNPSFWFSFKCGGKIVGEGSGCSAMAKLYHIACFRCHTCQCLLQGKPFYALDGKVSLDQGLPNLRAPCWADFISCWLSYYQHGFVRFCLAAHLCIACLKLHTPLIRKNSLLCL